MPESPPLILPRDRLDALIERLWAMGYEVHGPTVRDGAIVDTVLRRADQLPAGWEDEQAPGRYRLHRRDDGALFAHVVGPTSFKRLLFPPEEVVLRSRREGERWIVEDPAADGPPPRFALFGARACDLYAIAVQDRVFLEGPYVDAQYRRRRENLFIVAVNCTRAAATCFCVSTGSGPRARSGFDLALTEVLEPEHRFVLEVGSELGAEAVAPLGLAPAVADDLAAAERARAGARAQSRSLETQGLYERLWARRDDGEAWQAVAERCLSCANCTLVCPTCFCSDVEQVGDLADAGKVERLRRWDSCFNLAHSYVVGGPVRGQTAARYRQWLLHKLVTWQDQFGTLGCVGCGRCIGWCPVGIDLTEEAARIGARAPA